MLYDFEEIDIPAIEIDSDSIYVASVFKGGVKDHIFYTGDPDAFLIAANQRRSRLQGFKVGLECNNDPDWSVYKDFP